MIDLALIYTERGLEAKLPKRILRNFWHVIDLNKRPIRWLGHSFTVKLEDMSKERYQKILSHAVDPSDIPYIGIIILPELEDEADEATFGYCYQDFRYEDKHGMRPLIVLSANKIKKWSGPFVKWFGYWVLKHELGHAVGLQHHFNPFCVMSKPNISFGRFCRSCQRKGKGLPHIPYRLKDGDSAPK